LARSNSERSQASRELAPQRTFSHSTTMLATSANVLLAAA
jgi:hypothetical protein